MEKMSFSQMMKDKYASLSPGQKKIAEYLFDHQDEAVLQTAFQLGKRVGVSETTVIRFSYALGFSGFSDMQEKIRHDWFTTKKQEQVQDSSEEIELHEKVVKRESVKLKKLLNQLDKVKIDEAIDAILGARRIYIGGFGASFAAAHWLYYSLSQLKEHVFLSTLILPEQLSELKEDSVAIIFSFPRYTKESLKLAEWAKRQNATLIAITDRQFSPVGQISDITLTTEEQQESDYFSMVPVICLLEVIIEGIYLRDKERISNRQEMIERFYTEQELYLE